jgi:hypothetical protein
MRKRRIQIVMIKRNDRIFSSMPSLFIKRIAIKKIIVAINAEMKKRKLKNFSLEIELSILSFLTWEVSIFLTTFFILILSILMQKCTKNQNEKCTTPLDF